MPLAIMADGAAASRPGDVLLRSSLCHQILAAPARLFGTLCGTCVMVTGGGPKGGRGSSAARHNSLRCTRADATLVIAGCLNQGITLCQLSSAEVGRHDVVRS
jgi:hypothetical protein